MVVSGGGPAEMRGQRSEFGAGELASICWIGHLEGTVQREGPRSLLRIAHESVARLHKYRMRLHGTCLTEAHSGLRTE